MTMFHIWLLWTVDFTLFSIIMILRLAPVFSLRQRAWYAPQVFFVLFSLAGIGAGIFKLATEPTSTLAAPVGITYVVLAGVFFVFLGAAFVRELSRFGAYRAGRVASAYVAVRRYTDAAVIYDQLLKRYPKSAVSWVNKGNVLFFQDRFDDALAASDQALTLKPKYALAWALKAASLAEKQQYAEALAICEHALALSPRYAVAWSWKAQILERLGHLEEALAASDELLQLNSAESTDVMRSVAWSTKSKALTAQGNYSEALAAAEQAARLNPRPARARLAQAIALTHLGHSEEAQTAAEQGLAAADQIVVEHPTNVTAWQIKSDLLRFLGRAAEADTADDHARTLQSQMHSTKS